MATADVERVSVHLFDVSRGLAKALSPVLIGREVEGIYHTNVVVGGVEYSYGPPIRRYFVGQGPLGEPDRVLDLGFTSIPPGAREEIIRELSQRYSNANYDLLVNNCTQFANEMATILTGTGLPDDIMRQLESVVDSPLGEGLLKVLGGEAPPEGFFQEYGPILRDIFSNLNAPGWAGFFGGGAGPFGPGGPFGANGPFAAFAGRRGGCAGGWQRRGGRGCGGAWHGCAGRGCGDREGAATDPKPNPQRESDGAGPSGTTPDDKPDVKDSTATAPSPASEVAGQLGELNVNAGTAEGDFVVVEGEQKGEQEAKGEGMEQ